MIGLLLVGLGLGCLLVAVIGIPICEKIERRRFNRQLEKMPPRHGRDTTYRLNHRI